MFMEFLDHREAEKLKNKVGTVLPDTLYKHFRGGGGLCHAYLWQRTQN